MSKFVTYPAVTVLDNDHSLLIDDPNAGTNSITAENAGNTLLSKWAGFETFDEAVQNTISNNQEFIDRDTAIRSETAELKKKIVTTFPSKEASGAVATFKSEFEDAPLKSCIVQVEPVQDLHGYDSPWPGGGGKNLIPFPYASQAGTYNGITVTVNNDGTLVLNGTSTSAVFFDLVDDNRGIPLKAGSYILHRPMSNGISAVNITAVKNGAYWKDATLDNISLTLDEDANIAWYIRVAGGTTLTNEKIYPMFEAGTTASEWSPYENICPISGWTGVKVQRTGKNLCNQPVGRWIWTSNGLRYDNTSGKYCATEDKIPVKGGEQYIASFTDSGLNLSVYFVWFNEDNFIKADIKRGAPWTATAPQNATKVALSFANDEKYTGEPKISNVQLELGSTATAYEPYQGNTYPITFPSEAGTVYGAYVDVTGGELVVDRAMPSFDKATLYRDNGTYKLWMVTKLPRSVNSYGGRAICNITKSFGYVPSAALETKIQFPYGTNVTLFASIPADFNIADVQAVYELAAPIHYPLTPTEIKTLLGTNNIWSNTGDTIVEYLMSDVSWYVEKKLRAFQSILAGVEDSETSSKNYSANTYLIFNNDIYRVTKAITTGETIEEGVNVTKTTVAEQLMALAQA